jgi:serine protease SohB
MFGENTDADREKLQEEIHDTHALFKEFVAAHRPQVDVAAVGTASTGTAPGARTAPGRRAGHQRRLPAEPPGSADIFEVSCAQRRSARRRLASLMSGLPDELLDTRWAYR